MTRLHGKDASTLSGKHTPWIFGASFSATFAAIAIETGRIDCLRVIHYLSSIDVPTIFAVAVVV